MENNVRIFCKTDEDIVSSKTKLIIEDIKHYLDDLERTGNISHIDYISYLLSQIRKTENNDV